MTPRTQTKYQLHLPISPPFSITRTPLPRLSPPPTAAEPEVCIAPLMAEHQTGLEDSEADACDCHDDAFEDDQKGLVIREAAVEAGLELGDAVR